LQTGQAQKYAYAVLGAGRQGTAAAYDMAKFGSASKVTIGDVDLRQARRTASHVNRLFMNLKSIIWANDLSAKIVVDEVAPLVEKGKTHILIPDLLKVLSHQKVVSRNTITMLNSIMEEGLKNVMFYGARKEFKQPVRCAVIAAITKAAYSAREKHWKGIGFVGRCILVSFSYSDATKLKIHEHIRKGFPAKTIDIITGRPTRVEIPAKIARRVQDLAVAETPFSTGFRVHKQLRALVQAHALYCGRSKVKMEDFEEIRRLSKFMNLDFHQI